MTVLLCGSLQTHLGTQMPSGDGHIIRAHLPHNVRIEGQRLVAILVSERARRPAGKRLAEVMADQQVNILVGLFDPIGERP